MKRNENQICKSIDEIKVGKFRKFKFKYRLQNCTKPQTSNEEKGLDLGLALLAEPKNEKLVKSTKQYPKKVKKKP